MEITDSDNLLECTALQTPAEHDDTKWKARLVAVDYGLQLIELMIPNGKRSAIDTCKHHDSEFHHAMNSSRSSANLLALHKVLNENYLREPMAVLTKRGTKL